MGKLVAGKSRSPRLQRWQGSGQSIQRVVAGTRMNEAKVGWKIREKSRHFRGHFPRDCPRRGSRRCPLGFLRHRDNAGHRSSAAPIAAGVSPWFRVAPRPLEDYPPRSPSHTKGFGAACPRKRYNFSQCFFLSVPLRVLGGSFHKPPRAAKLGGLTGFQIVEEVLHRSRPSEPCSQFGKGPRRESSSTNRQTLEP